MPISPNQGSTGGGTLVTITDEPVQHQCREVRQQVRDQRHSGFADAGHRRLPRNRHGGSHRDHARRDQQPAVVLLRRRPLQGLPRATSGPLAGGNTITLNGIGLSTATSVSFGGTTATPTVVSDSQLSVVVPAGAASGPVGVSVTTAGGSNNGLTYTYIDDPTIGTITPASGPTSGGTAVTITGTNLDSTESVKFGGVAAPFSVINATTLSAVTPPGTAGAVDVVVTNPSGSATVVGGFTYVAGPGI
ncbi:hypothetical protein SALBM311S_10025 [Streptomyces alboniger]